MFCAGQLTVQDKVSMKRVQDDLIYICGNQLFPDGELSERIVVRQGLNCGSPIEILYFSGKECKNCANRFLFKFYSFENVYTPILQLL